MQPKTTKRWRFTKKDRNTSLPKQGQPSQAASRSFVLYQSINELPLSRWMDLTVDGNLYALVKSGEPPKEELYILEQKLRVQYADAIGDNEYRLYCSTLNEINNLEIKREQIRRLIEVMYDAYHPALGDMLNKLQNEKFDFNTTDRAKFEHLLSRAANRSKSLNIAIDLAKSKARGLEEKYKAKGDAPTTRDYYYGILLTLGDEAGRDLQADIITTWEFCERIKRANQKAERTKMKRK